MSRPLLVLRPEPGAGETRARAEALGLEALAVPLFAVEPVAWTPPDPARFDALMLTSANALRHAGDSLALYRALPVYAVGAETARAAHEAGFGEVIEGAGDAAALAATLAAAGRKAVLHLCGADRRAVPSDIPIEAVPVYRAAALPPPPALSGAIARAPVVLLHSPRAAARFAALVPGEARAALSLVAISPAAAEAAGTGWRDLAAASRPADQAMLEIAARLCEQGSNG